jgi:threonine aldolase
LNEDHVNARRLADGIAGLIPECIDPMAVETNMVFVDTSSLGLSPWETRDRLEREGVLVTVVAGRVRMLTHLDVTAGDIEAAVGAWGRVVATLR